MFAFKSGKTIHSFSSVLGSVTKAMFINFFVSKILLYHIGYLSWRAYYLQYGATNDY